MFSDFDLVRIINLRHRVDRRREMLLELQGVGVSLSDRVQFFEAIRPAESGAFSSPGARGVFESHLEIIRTAAAAGHSVLIVEDDCDFLEGAERYQVPKGTDVFYGGYDATNREDLANSDIIGAHLMGLSVIACRKFIEYYNQLSIDRDHPPIDGFYVWLRRAHPELSTHFAQPVLGHQRPSLTDIAKRHPIDRIALLRPLVRVARSLKRRHQRFGRPHSRR